MNASKAKLPLLLVLLFLLASWVIALGGLAALQDYCDDDNAEDDVSFFQVFADCAKVYSYQWWYLFFQLVVMVFVAAVILSGKSAAWRVALVGILAIFAVKTADFANEALHMVWQTDGTLEARYNCFVAGQCLMFIGTFLWIVMFGLMEETEASSAPPAKTAPPV